MVTEVYVCGISRPEWCCVSSKVSCDTRSRMAPAALHAAARSTMGHGAGHAAPVLDARPLGTSGTVASCSSDGVVAVWGALASALGCRAAGVCDTALAVLPDSRTACGVHTMAVLEDEVAQPKKRARRR